MSGWEEIDSDSSDHFAVVFGEDYSIQPDAIFRSREDADAYVAWQLSLPPSDDRYVPRDVTVLAMRELRGTVWNSYDPLPEDGPPEKPKPAPSSRPSVKVRIPVRVRAGGSWTASSFHSSDMQEGRAGDQFADTPVPHVDVWVEAEVPLPEEPPTIEGRVTREDQVQS